MIWLILAGLLVLYFIGNIIGRWFDYWTLVEYTEINNYARNADKDELEQLFAGRLKEKSYLLAYREKMLSESKVKEFTADLQLHRECENIYRRLFVLNNRITYCSWTSAFLHIFSKH